MRIWFLIVLTLGLLSSCRAKGEKNNQDKTTNIDTTFHFSIKDATDFIDSRTGKLTRSYNSGEKSVYFGFTIDEIQRIKALYFELRLDTLPDNYEPDCAISILPTFNEEYSINYMGKCKRFIYNADYECYEYNTKLVVSNMQRFVYFMYEILNKKEKIKQLEKSDIVFM
jgi:hypothetical protein